MVGDTLIETIKVKEARDEAKKRLKITVPLDPRNFTIDGEGHVKIGPCEIQSRTTALMTQQRGTLSLRRTNGPQKAC